MSYWKFLLAMAAIYLVGWTLFWLAKKAIAYVIERWPLA